MQFPSAKQFCFDASVQKTCWRNIVTILKKIFFDPNISTNRKCEGRNCLSQKTSFVHMVEPHAYRTKIVDVVVVVVVVTVKQIVQHCCFQKMRIEK